MPFLAEKLGESEALILGAPAYDLMAPGFVTMISNRILGAGKQFREQCAKRPKIGAMITLGGTDWTNMVLPVTYNSLLMFTANSLVLVDQFLENYVPAVGQVVLRDKAIARASKLGRNVGEAMKLPANRVKYLGDEEETCPLCHQNLLQIKGKAVVCPICDIEGSIALERENLKITFTGEWLRKRRFGEWGEQKHLREIMMGHQEYAEKMEEVRAKREKYNAYNVYVFPPSLEGE